MIETNTLKLRKACRLFGLQPEYYDAKGELVRVPSNDLLSLLSIRTEQKLTSSSLDSLIEARFKELLSLPLPKVLVAEEDRELTVVYRTTSHESCDFKISIQLEFGKTLDTPILKKSRSQSAIEKKHKVFRWCLRVKSPPVVGYHELELTDVIHKTKAKAHFFNKSHRTPHSLNKKWGLFLSMSNLRGPGNQGLGDLGDLQQVQGYLKSVGGAFVGTLPFFASDFTQDPGPYAPTSKIFWNETFLDLEEISKKYKIKTREYLEESEGTADTLDFAHAAKVKAVKIQDYADHFFAHEGVKSAEYQLFMSEKPLVSQYAEYRSKGSQEKLRFHLFSQFQMHLQLKRCAQNEVGLYLDFPVGSSNDGFDFHYFKNEFLPHFCVGAPPDLFFSAGQNWGFAPLNPDGCQETGYKYLRHSLKEALKYSRYLRLDHAMGLKRIYVMNRESKSGAQGGTYLHYPQGEMFAVLNIELSRSGAELIAEDLGTVPASFRHYIEDQAYLGMWVLPFETQSEPKKAMQKITAHKLACLNTHDMVPFAGYVAGRDIEVFQQLKIFSKDQAAEESQNRKEQVQAWFKNEAAVDTQQLFEKITLNMARSSAPLMVINAEDLWQETEPLNVPGTWREYPNWKRIYKKSFGDWSQNSSLANFLNKVSQARQENLS